ICLRRRAVCLLAAVRRGRVTIRALSLPVALSRLIAARRILIWLTVLRGCLSGLAGRLSAILRSALPIVARARFVRTLLAGGGGCLGSGLIGLSVSSARLSGLALQLIHQLIEFLLRKAQRLGIIAEDAFGGALDAALEIFEAGAHPLAGSRGLGQKILAHEFGGGLHQLRAIRLRRASQALIE